MQYRLIARGGAYDPHAQWQPAKTGVTATLLRIIEEEARAAGAEVEWVDVSKLSVRPASGA